MRQRVEHATTRFDTLAYALVRGDWPRAGACVEIVSGTDRLTGLLGEIFGLVLTVDISEQMPTGGSTDPVGSTVRSGAPALPIATGSLAAVVCTDAFPCLAEIRRVLRPDGALLWINRPGAEPPPFPDTSALVGALGGGWSAAESESRWGRWTVLRRG
jgi:SAM-dependent methyltransferase